MTVSGALADGLPAEAFAKAGMAQMSEKFRQMGEQVYVDAATAVKESNKAF
jgi:phosphomethylpyrimidine synthase